MVYLHVPFCRSFCSYCSFYSELLCGGDASSELTSYTDAVCAEILRREEEIADTLAVNTLYIGGGTPSVLPLDHLSRIVSAIGRVTGGRYSEFTVEVNPDDILRFGQSYVEGLLALGVNRVSMGVQSFDDKVLKQMSRRHDASSAREAYRILREAGVRNISVDIIFGWPSMGPLLFETLEGILSLPEGLPEHISAYQLSIDEGCALWGRDLDLPSDEECSRQYYEICSTLRSAGYEHYEISNFARTGFRAEHNSAYWKRTPYVGLGPGAHSFAGDKRYWNTDTLSGYGVETELLSPSDIRTETLMLALRTSDGIDERTLEELCEDDKLSSLIEGGYLRRAGEAKIRIPEEHFFICDNIIRDLL